jgi:hypothetical protein
MWLKREMFFIELQKIMKLILELLIKQDFLVILCPFFDSSLSYIFNLYSFLTITQRIGMMTSVLNWIIRGISNILMAVPMIYLK